MRNFRLSATTTGILGFLSILALIFQYLALCDIAQMEENLTLEWYITGLCMIVFGTFVISTFVTLGFILKYSRFFQINNETIHPDKNI
jgi:hypothetical protein